MSSSCAIQCIHRVFFRHDRIYCIFSVSGNDNEFLYYSHQTRPLRSLLFGKKIRSRLLGLMDKEDLCIECGIGLSAAGGVVLDDGDCITWHYSVEEANRVLIALRQKMEEYGHWVELF